jgi:hypothetical protein
MGYALTEVINMVRLLIGLMIFASTGAFAQMSDPSKAPPNNISATLSFAAPSPVFGIAFEHMMKDSMGLGAGLKMWQKEEGSKARDGFLVVGVNAGYHFYKKDWDLSFTPSLNIMNIKGSVGSHNTKDATSLAPGVSFGILCQVAPNFGVGFDWSAYQAWFDSTYAGTMIQDIAVRGRFHF